MVAEGGIRGVSPHGWGYRKRWRPARCSCPLSIQVRGNPGQRRDVPGLVLDHQAAAGVPEYPPDSVAGAQCLAARIIEHRHLVLLEEIVRASCREGVCKYV